MSNSVPIAVAVVGHKNSGKTTLCLELARALRDRGRKVAMAKFSGCGFNEPETSDTAQFKAVAHTVLGLADDQSFVSWPKRLPLQNLAPLAMNGPDGADLLLVEGGKELGMLPRIVLADDDQAKAALSNGLALAVLPTKPGADRVGELADLILSKGFLLPGLDCSACGREDCSGLAREIVAGDAAPSECMARQSKLTVHVEGRPLDVNPFVERILSSGLKAMLAELKGFGPGRIEISMD